MLLLLGCKLSESQIFLHKHVPYIKNRTLLSNMNSSKPSNDPEIWTPQHFEQNICPHKRQ